MATDQTFLPFEPPIPSPALLTASEIYEQADASLLRLLAEDRRIERKPVGIQADYLGVYLSMWANSPPDGGLIAIGIEDDGVISGCLKAEQSHINDLEKAARTYCSEARCETKRIPFRHEKGQHDYVLLMYVHYKPAGRLVRTNKNKAFVRLGDEKKELNEYEIRELEIDRGQIDFEQEPTDYEYPQDFLTDLIQAYASSFYKARELREEISVEELLAMRHLGKVTPNGFIPNNACALLFAKDPQRAFPGCKIRFLRFEGETEGTGERWNPIRDNWIDSGPIPLQIEEAVRIIDSQIRTFTRLGSDNKFHTEPEYPKTAWFEALVNACAHRSYNIRNMYVAIRMFEDRLEITSPGAFPPLVNPDNIYFTQHARNPHLMDVMIYLGYARAAREGARRIRDSMAAMELPKPEFRQRQKGDVQVQVILRNAYKQRKALLDADAMAVVGEAIFKTLAQDERRAINFAAEHGAISVSDLQRLTQKTWPASKRLLEGLKKKGILKDKRRTSLKVDPQARYLLNTAESSEDE
jgi:ATP-dependent DNA helicase RecG